MHSAKNAATLTKLKSVDGLVGWVTQKGLIDTVKKMKFGNLPESSIAKTFDEMFNNILPKADELLAIEGVPQRLNKIALSVVENPSVPNSKDIDRQVNIVRLALDIDPETTKKALGLIENVLTSSTTKQHTLDIIQNIRKTDTTETFINLIEDNGTEIIPLLRKYGDKVENIVDLIKKHQNIDVLDIVKKHSDEPEYVVKLFDYKPYTVECEKYIQPDKYKKIRMI